MKNNHRHLAPMLNGRPLTITVRRRPLINLAVQGVLGTIAATFWLIPVAEAWMYQLLFATSLATAVWYVLRYGRHLGLLQWYVLSYTALFYIYPIISPMVLRNREGYLNHWPEYTLLTIGGLHLLLWAYELGYRRTEEQDRVYLIRFKRLKMSMLVLTLIHLVGIGLVVAEAGSFGELLHATRTDRKLVMGNLTNMASQLFFIGALLYAVLPIYLAHRRFSLLGLGIIIILLAVDVILLFAYRARTFLVMHAVALGVGYFYINRRISIGGYVAKTWSNIGTWRRWRRIGAIVLGGLAIVVASIYIRFARGSYQEVDHLSSISVDWERAIELTLTSGDLGYAPTVLEVLATVPRRHDYLLGQSYYRLLFVPIPRILWDGKPLNTQRIVGQWLRPELSEFTLPPGIQGDAYINFGTGGTLIFVIFGVGIGAFDRWRGIGYLFTMAVIFPAVFHLARGGFTNPVIIITVQAAGAWLVGHYLLGGSLLRLPSSARDQ